MKKFQLQAIIKIQSCIKRFLNNTKQKIQMKNLNKNATKIQKFLKKCRHRLNTVAKKVLLAGIVIQKFWRGYMARKYVKALILYNNAVIIQTVCRKYAAKIYVSKLRIQMNKAARIIQSAYLYWYSRQKLAIQLFEREERYRDYVILYLTVDEVRIYEKLTKVALRMIKSQIREEYRDMYQSYEMESTMIENKMKEYEELICQRDALSPLAIHQGWKVEIDANVENARAELTDMKKRLIFDAAANLQSKSWQLDKSSKELIALVETRERLKNWKAEVS
jgi:acyl-CoA-binding protein